MDIELPGTEILFSHMQEVLHHVQRKRATLTKGVHKALSDFRWMVQDRDVIY